MAREERKMSVVADPNAIQHLDALFDVVHVHRRQRHSSSVVTTTNTELLDALFEVVHSPRSSNSGGSTPNPKSWKERKLPPSFFNADCSPGPRSRSPDKCNRPEPQHTQKTPVPSSPQQKLQLHKPSTPIPTLKVLSTRPNPVTYAVTLPLTWQGATPSDYLTYCIE